MRYRQKVSVILFLIVIYAVSAFADNGCNTRIVRNTKQLLNALQSLNSKGDSSSARTVIRVEPNVYVLYDTARIIESNVSVIAEPGTKVLLADHVNKPVIAIGSQEEVPTFTVENIYISGIEIDGNKENQDSEYDADRPWIRNNGIDVRAVKRLTIENVVSKNNRSGGLVVSWGSSDIYVVNSEFDDNFFDGVAYYDSKRMFTTNSSMKNNNNAGISLDNDLSDSSFSNCILDSNGDVGVFMRFSKELRFNNCAIKNSGSWAVFLGHDENNNGVHDIMFSGCQFLNNKGGVFMSSVDESQSSFNSVTGSVLRGNEQDGRLNIQSAGSVLWTSGNVEMH